MFSKSAEESSYPVQGLLALPSNGRKAPRGSRSLAAPSAALLLAVAFCMGAVACGETKRKVDALEAAQKIFSEFQNAAAERDKVLALTDTRLFGRGQALLLLAVPAGGDEINKIADSPETYEVVMPFWSSGKNQSGQTARQKREMKLKLIAAPGGTGWKVENRSFSEAQPLNFAVQGGMWLLNALFSPLWLGGFFGLITWSRKVMLIVVQLTALPMAGYSGYVSFGSWWAVWICLAIFITLGAIVRGVLSRA